MTEGLTLNEDSIKVQISGVDVDTSKYTLKTSGVGNYTFTIDFDNTWIADQIGKSIIINYSATLNENAIISGDNKNTANLQYGNKPENEKDTTPDSVTTTKTWKVDVEKFTYVQNEGGGQTEQKLAGATFTLSKDNTGSNPIAFVSLGNNVYRVAMTGDTSTVTEITTDASGKFTLQGLDSDTYYLTEKKAPTGYNKLAGPVTVTIDNEGKINKTNDNPNGVTAVKIQNSSGSKLPTTGGMGSILFYIFGAVLMFGAAVLLITKCRMNAR